MVTSNMNFWDPVEKIDLSEINSSNKSINDDFNSFKTKPNLSPSIKTLLGVFLSLIEVFLLIFMFYIIDNVKTHLKLLVVISVILLVIVLISILYLFSSAKGQFKKINLLSKSLIDLTVADLDNLLSDSRQNSDKLESYSSRYVDIFNLGTFGNHISNQFWGSKKSSLLDFTTGIYSYTVQEYNSQNKTYKNIEHDVQYLIFKLSKTKIVPKFVLFSEDDRSLASKISNKKEINVESIEFNKLFAFDYDSKKSDVQLSIVNLLSPVLQTKLIDLAKTYSNIRILFDKNEIVLLFKSRFLEHLDTNLFKTKDLNKNDVDKLQTSIKSCVDLCIGIDNAITV